VPLSWNEIRHRAITFAREWKGETREAAERQTFWNEFFNVFGVRRRTVATFEEPVKKLSGDWGFIDLFWPGRLLVEHKSAGADLGKAHAQGMDYIRGLKDTGRDREIPRWLIFSDFNRIALHDLEPKQDPDAPLLQQVLRGNHCASLSLRAWQRISFGVRCGEGEKTRTNDVSARRKNNANEPQT